LSCADTEAETIATAHTAPISVNTFTSYPPLTAAPPQTAAQQ
jgi:hypothetical protein